MEVQRVFLPIFCWPGTILLDKKATTFLFHSMVHSDSVFTSPKSSIAVVHHSDDAVIQGYVCGISVPVELGQVGTEQ